MGETKESTSVLRSLSDRLNGAKKKIAIGGAATGVVSVATILATIGWINTNYGQLTGLAVIPQLVEKSDTVVALAADVRTLKDGQDHIAAQATQTALAVARIEGLLAGMASKENVTLKQNRDTVIVYFDVRPGDVARSFWRRGPTTDSMMIPVVRDSL